MGDTVGGATGGAGFDGEQFKRASDVLLNLSTTDKDLINFLTEFYSSENGLSEGGLQAINYLMNMRSQRASLLSNLEDKRHNSAMSIINNLK